MIFSNSCFYTFSKTTVTCLTGYILLAHVCRYKSKWFQRWWRVDWIHWICTLFHSYELSPKDCRPINVGYYGYCIDDRCIHEPKSPLTPVPIVYPIRSYPPCKYTSIYKQMRACAKSASGSEGCAAAICVNEEERLWKVGLLWLTCFSPIQLLDCDPDCERM